MAMGQTDKTVRQAHACARSMWHSHMQKNLHVHFANGKQILFECNVNRGVGIRYFTLSRPIFWAFLYCILFLTWSHSRYKSGLE